jgi:micrococcal nuclease
MDPYWYRASVVKVIDGDTLDIDIDLGFDIWHSIRVRLYGIDAAEVRSSNAEIKESGLKAKEFVKNWFDRRGYNILIQTKRDKTEKYGRILAEVYSGLDNLNNDLITEGLAKPYFGVKK